MMDLAKNISTHQHQPIEEPAISESTTTFLIGFGILLIFVIIGVLASAFLCMTLKKDPYLWEVVFDPQAQPYTQPQEPNNHHGPNKSVTDSTSLDGNVQL